jgi:hypothetical protein
MIVRHGGENGVASVRATELIVSLRQTFEGDEEPTALGDPLGNGMLEFFAVGQVHWVMVRSMGNKKKVRTNGAHGVTRPTQLRA